jgi:hypothetical protein
MAYSKEWKANYEQVKYAVGLGENTRPLYYKEAILIGEYADKIWYTVTQQSSVTSKFRD